MSGIVQHTSIGQLIYAGGPSAVSLAFNSNVTKGNLIVAVVDDLDVNVVGVMDGGGTMATAVAVGIIGLTEVGSIYYGIAPASGAMTVTANFNGTTNTLTNAHLHIYEVAGYNALDATGSNGGQGSGTSFSVSTSSPTARPNEFVIAAFYGFGVSGNPVTWTPEAGAEGKETTGEFSGGNTFFSEGFEVTSTGTITATATTSQSTQTGLALIATFFNKTTANPPTISPNSGYGAPASPLTVTLTSDLGAAATIWYTTDGSIPVPGVNGTAISSGGTVTVTRVGLSLLAVVAANLYFTSAPASGIYGGGFPSGEFGFGYGYKQGSPGSRPSGFGLHPKVERRATSGKPH